MLRTEGAKNALYANCKTMARDWLYADMIYVNVLYAVVGSWQTWHKLCMQVNKLIGLTRRIRNGRIRLGNVLCLALNSLRIRPVSAVNCFGLTAEKMYAKRGIRTPSQSENQNQKTRLGQRSRWCCAIEEKLVSSLAAVATATNTWASTSPLAS